MLLNKVELECAHSQETLSALIKSHYPVIDTVRELREYVHACDNSLVEYSRCEPGFYLVNKEPYSGYCRIQCTPLAVQYRDMFRIYHDKKRDLFVSEPVSCPVVLIDDYPVIIVGDDNAMVLATNANDKEIPRRYLCKHSSKLSSVKSPYDYTKVYDRVFYGMDNRVECILNEQYNFV